MPQARVRDGKRYRYFSEAVGDWCYAEGGELVEVPQSALKGARDFLEPVGVVGPIGEQDEPYADSGSVLDGPWNTVCSKIAEIDDPELLQSLREDEVAEKNRGSVLSAIDDALSESSADEGDDDADEGDAGDEDGDDDGEEDDDAE